MKWIGLTGGVATGKTTVANMLRNMGFPVVDADKIAKEVVEPRTEGFDKIVKLFGRTIVLEDGTLNRKQLGKIVFSDLEKRKALEAAIHPIIQKRVEEIRQKLKESGTQIAFYDVPLLYEKGLEKNFDCIVVVACSSPTQLKRLMERDKLSLVDAKDRIASQWPISEKSGRADYVIWNEGDLNDLQFAFDNFLKWLQLTMPTNNPIKN